MAQCGLSSGANAGDFVRGETGRWQEEFGGLDHSPQQGTPALGGRELVPFMDAKHRAEVVEDDDCVEVEVELDDEDLHPSSFLAMVRFYSGERLNERGLFEEMRIAWGLASLAAPKGMGDNKYLLEFDSEEV
jgi:hypothetical protein